MTRGCLQGGWTALMLAAKEGKLDVVGALVAAGADPNTTDKASGPWVHVGCLCEAWGHGCDGRARAVWATTGMGLGLGVGCRVHGMHTGLPHTVLEPSWP